MFFLGGRGATASRPFAERLLISRASYPDPTKTFRLRTPRSGAPTRGRRMRCHRIPTPPPEAYIHLCTGRRPICTFAQPTPRYNTVVTRSRPYPMRLGQHVVLSLPRCPRAHMSPCPRVPSRSVAPTFAQAAGRFALLHLGQLGVPSLPLVPVPPCPLAPLAATPRSCQLAR